MTYIEVVKKYIEQQNIGDPIYVDDIALIVAKHFNLDKKKALAATSVAIKRIMDGNKINNLRFYQKGIYYLCNTTAFGETGINKNKLIEDRYIANDNGYETGLGFLNKLGLTTQIPNQIVISTNKAKECQRDNTKLGIKVVPPKTQITNENKKYLQVLDVFEFIEKAPVDAEKPYQLVNDYIDRNKLDYRKLLSLANQYYPKRILLQLAKTAEAGGI